MAQINVLHGPNLNMLGKREPGHYGNDTLQDINARLITFAVTEGHQCECFQSNAEFELINKIHQYGEQQVDFIIINPAAFTHTSIAIRDALLAVNIPFIEVHLSNVYQRETFRHHSYFSDVAKGTITGLGAQGYEFALQSAMTQLQLQKN